LREERRAIPESGWRSLLRRLGRRFTRHPAGGGEAHPAATQLALSDGTPVLVRAIEPLDADALAEALERLSPESRYQRFLSDLDRLTPAQLEYLTHVDGINHLALGVAVVQGRARAPRPIAVARCIRDPSEPELAEVAIVVADEWQRRGVGSLLFGMLAERAREVGIRRWKAVMLAENAGARKLLEEVGTRLSTRLEGPGSVEAIYELRPPAAIVPETMDEEAKA
jgi:GNAT superfamily N-acetyltransferase